LGQIDINCDLGEGYGVYQPFNDHLVMPLISSCNIACGFHAGDSKTIVSTIQMAVEYGVNVGAHPSFPDLQGFGRRNMNLSKDEIFALILYQVSALKGMTESLGAKLHHVKLHGALYNMSAENEEMAVSAFEAVKKIDESIIVYGLPNSFHESVALGLSIPFHSEAFADRLYTDQGHLASREIEGSVIKSAQEVAIQFLNLASGNEVRTISGDQLKIKKPHTICFHGDHPNILENLKQAHRLLKSNGITLSKHS